MLKQREFEAKKTATQPQNLSNDSSLKAAVDKVQAVLNTPKTEEKYFICPCGNTTSCRSREWVSAAKLSSYQRERLGLS